MKKVCLVILSGIALTSCAGSYKDFKPTDVKPDEGAALGKIQVRYNGKPYNGECTLCFVTEENASAGGPCQKLTPEGYVFFAAKKGRNYPRRLECKDTSVQHNAIQRVVFEQGANPTYFGQIEVDWKNKGGFKVSSMFGALGAAIDESSHDGELSVRVTPGNAAEVIAAFEKQTGVKSARVQQKIAQAY